MLKTMLIATCALASCAATASAANRACKDDERVDIVGRISSIFPCSGATCILMLNNQPTTGTCLISNVVYKGATPKTCVDGATFTANGKALRTMTDRLIADSLTCN